MKSKERNILLVAVLATLLFMVFNCLTGKAGSLQPNAPPEPTMVTLGQLSAQIEALSSPVERVVRGVITFERNETIASSDFSPAVDPNRSVVLLSDVVASSHDGTIREGWICRTSACLLGLTETQITVQVELPPNESKVSYQIIEYR